MNEVCSHCGKKEFNPSTGRCYACKSQFRRDGTPVVVPDGYTLDRLDNVRSAGHSEIKDSKLYIAYHYLLEDGKITLRGEYRKLANPPQCVRPERLSCNDGDGFYRCEFMENAGGVGQWRCSTAAGTSRVISPTPDPEKAVGRATQFKTPARLGKSAKPSAHRKRGERDHGIPRSTD